MKKKNDVTVLKWIIKVAGSGNRWMLALLCARTVQGCTGVLYALLLGELVDGAVSGDKQVFFTRLLRFALLILFCVLLQALLRYLTEKTTALMTKNFRQKLFHELLNREYERVAGEHTGQWMNRMTSDTSVVVNAWSQMLPGISGTLVRLLSAVGALMFMLPKLVYLLLPAGIALGLLSLVFRKKLKSYHSRIQELDGKAHSFLQERLSSLLVVHSFTREQTAEDAASELLEQVSRAKLRRIHFVNLCNTVLHCALYGAQILGVGMCGWQILQGRMSYGDMSAVLHLVGQMEAPLAGISGYLPQYYAMVASAERLMEPEHFRPDVAGQVRPEAETRAWYSEKFQTLAFENVSFAYESEGSRTALTDLSLELQKGQTVAFTGPSGCGKSTAMKLMMGLYTPEKGGLALIEADGTRHSLDGTWRTLFAYVPQGNQLMSGTVRQTLTFGEEASADSGEIWQALKVACAEEFVRQLPEMLDASLGEGGSGLSEGQMQRLAIARAVLSKRPILLLDEATSALDAATEAKLLENLRTMTDRTLVLISHREAALAACQRQISFENEL